MNKVNPLLHSSACLASAGPELVAGCTCVYLLGTKNIMEVRDSGLTSAVWGVTVLHGKHAICTACQLERSQQTDSF